MSNLAVALVVQHRTKGNHSRPEGQRTASATSYPNHLLTLLLLHKVISKTPSPAEDRGQPRGLMPLLRRASSLPRWEGEHSAGEGMPYEDWVKKRKTRKQKRKREEQCWRESGDLGGLQEGRRSIVNRFWAGWGWGWECWSQWQEMGQMEWAQLAQKMAGAARRWKKGDHPPEGEEPPTGRLETSGE